MSKSAVCFGEVLWDGFADRRVAGGAPMNVAIRLQSLGISTRIISRVGQDADGEALREIMHARGVDSSLVQGDDQIATGEVRVTLDARGNASFDIVLPAAWDRIGFTTRGMLAVEAADAFVFGSLACRDAVSKDTLLRLLKHAKYKVFDVNLRPPFDDLETVETLMRQSNFIKLNHDELDTVATVLGLPDGAMPDKMHFLADHTGAAGVCVTRGGDGALLLLHGRIHACDGFQIEVADTVGAGDSFLAALLARLLHSHEPDQALVFACRVGAAVAARHGANPELSAAEIEQVLGDSPKG
jgi:fructokinase